MLSTSFDYRKLHGLLFHSCSCLSTNVVCSSDWDIRLVNGANQREGRVEVCLNGVWGSVCDDSWDDDDAGTVCTGLGYPRRGIVGSA